MNGKILILKELFFSQRNLAINSEGRRIYKIFMISYLLQCMFRNKTNFTLSFNGKFIQNRTKRIKDWFIFIEHKCYELYLKALKKDANTFLQYELIYYGAKKPIHCKVSNGPDEQLLDYILNKHGFKVVDEHIGTIKSEYQIVKI